ncbi:hypothetical protein GGQ85_003539 [Nitrobacter vulgaris]|uniref:hypothetical protein n=1 Tax=Nitrobacter vulgaris TaxID=29421 RepID=UPI002861A547|nr:hypothetical protein [Nitrobacter vulgaris]MDR6305814.1 hypothetical protein [Nitrobacter vulgaris]
MAKNAKTTAKKAPKSPVKTKTRKNAAATIEKKPTGQPVNLMTQPMQLPLVDPNFRFVERQPEQLHAYARGLLQHLRQIRAGGKAGGYHITTVKAAAVWLIESYAEAGVAPVSEMARLIDEIVQPQPTASTLPVRRSSEDTYWAAIEFEAGHHLDPTARQPSAASLYAVAKHVRARFRPQYSSQKTAEATVRGWRRLLHYRTNVALQRSSALRVKT